jgi:hypothetical protein
MVKRDRERGGYIWVGWQGRALKAFARSPKNTDVLVYTCHDTNSDHEIAYVYRLVEGAGGEEVAAVEVHRQVHVTHRLLVALPARHNAHVSQIWAEVENAGAF